MTTEASSVPAVGDRFPNVSLPLLDGGELRFTGLQGKKVLIFMWGSW
ncbi:MAG: peroxiredoxin family protein [Chloroflexota bacterium]|nr:peroxiredoxin family protein [Chloroflexota bacterium]